MPKLLCGLRQRAVKRKQFRTASKSFLLLQTKLLMLIQPKVVYDLRKARLVLSVGRENAWHGQPSQPWRWDRGGVPWVVGGPLSGGLQQDLAVHHPRTAAPGRAGPQRCGCLPGVSERVGAALCFREGFF